MADFSPRRASGLVAAALVAAAARRRRSLSRSGAVAATGIGAVVVGGGGWWWGILLVAFFASSSALSGRRLAVRSERGDGREPAAGIAARGSERDAVQVLANGGLAALLALAAAPLSRSRPALYAGFVGTLAAATADTWATEVGAHSRTPPRLIVGCRAVPAGTSGGVTPVSSAASAAGALSLAGLAAAGAAVGIAPGRPAVILVAGTAAGLAGSLLDSLLGATLQAAYRCPRCAVPTERRIHGCGTPTHLVRGHPRLDNDAVNFAATLTGALVALATASAAGSVAAREGDAGGGPRNRRPSPGVPAAGGVELTARRP